MTAVSALRVAPVKALALVQRDEVFLDRFGVAENRRFYLIHAESSKRLSAAMRAKLAPVRANYDERRNVLSLCFSDGRVVEASVELGEEVTTPFATRPVRGRVVEGPFAEALRRELGREVRLARCDEPGATIDPGRAVSLVSRASVELLTRASNAPKLVDVRRFRMLIEVDGCEAHEEESWAGRHVRIGEAVVLVREPLERCVVTEHDPETGQRDFPTLDAIRAYRGLSERGTIDFGVVGAVSEPGRVRVGDPVEPLPS